MYRLTVLSLVQIPHHQTQTDDQTNKSVASELLSAVLGVVNVERFDLVGEVGGHPQYGEVEGPGLSSGPTTVGQAARHEGGETGETDRGLVSKLYSRGLDSQYHVIILILPHTSVNIMPIYYGAELY